MKLANGKKRKSGRRLDVKHFMHSLVTHFLKNTDSSSKHTKITPQKHRGLCWKGDFITRLELTFVEHVCSYRYQLSSFQSGLVVSLSLFGALAGSAAAFVVGDPIGRRKELLLAATLYCTPFNAVPLHTTPSMTTPSTPECLPPSPDLR